MEERREDNNEVSLDKKTIDVLVANIIPTSKYFEARFDHLQSQIDIIWKDVNDVKSELKEFEKRVDSRFTELKSDIDKRFEQVDKRFEQVDKRFEEVNKRFEQVDRRFEQIDKRFEQIELKFDKLIERIDTRIDAGMRENRNFTLKLFTFAMTFSAISVIALIGRVLRLF